MSSMSWWSGISKLSVASADAPMAAGQSGASSDDVVCISPTSFAMHDDTEDLRNG
jgi:hypothetical protein